MPKNTKIPKNVQKLKSKTRRRMLRRGPHTVLLPVKKKERKKERRGWNENKDKGRRNRKQEKRKRKKEKEEKLGQGPRNKAKEEKKFVGIAASSARSASLPVGAACRRAGEGVSTVGLSVLIQYESTRSAHLGQR